MKNINWKKLLRGDSLTYLLVIAAYLVVSLAEKNIRGEHGLGKIRFEKVLGQLQELCNKYGYNFDKDMLESAVQFAWQTLIGKSDSQTKTEQIETDTTE